MKTAKGLSKGLSKGVKGGEELQLLGEGTSPPTTTLYGCGGPPQPCLEVTQNSGEQVQL